MTTINAVINDLPFGSAAKRIDIWHEVGGIGRWELLFDDISGGSELLQPNMVASNLGINGFNLMQGYVDDILPSVADGEAVLSKYCRVVGRNYGRDLAAKFLIKNYAKWKLDDLIEDALISAGSEITYDSAGTAPEVDLTFNKTYLQQGFAEAANKVGYDFTVLNSKVLQLWPLSNPPNSGITLMAVAGSTQNNILLIDSLTRAGIDIYNYIRVDGGVLNDHWTEANAEDWSIDVGASFLEDDFSVFLVGAGSLKVTSENNAVSTRVSLSFPRYNYDYLPFDEKGAEQCSVYVMHDSDQPAAFRIFLTDDQNNEIMWLHENDSAGNKWIRIDFVMGVDAPFSSEYKPKVWKQITGSTFTWRIKKIAVQCNFLAGVNHFWIDGLSIGGVDVWAYAEDSNSIATYGKRMLPLIRTDIKSQRQLQQVADAELESRKNPITKLKLTCTFQPSILYAGYLVNVLAPDAHIGSGSTPEVFRILSVHHVAEPGVDLCKGHDAITELELVKHEGGAIDPVRAKLASNPQAAINVRHDSRLRVLEQSLAGPSSVGAGGGAVINWDDVPYINVKGIANFEDMAHHTLEFPQLSWNGQQPTVHEWMYNNNYNDFREFATGSNVRFKDTISQYATDIYGVLLTEPETAPAVAVSHHLLVRKDFLCRGMVSTFEGALVVYGGSDYRGWGPDGPMIFLARGGDNGAYDTLYLTILQNQQWQVGNIKLNQVKFKGSAVISEQDTGYVCLTTSNDKGLMISNAGIKGVFLDNGGIQLSLLHDNSDGYLTVHGGHLKIAAENGKQIILLNAASALSIQPAVNNAFDLGSASLAWHDIFSAYAHIGELTVTQDIYADVIYGYTDVDLRIEPYSGRKVYVAGTLRADAYENLPSLPPSAHTHVRSDITDFWSTPFWSSIPDKPSVFPPSNHASQHGSGGGDPITSLGDVSVVGSITLTNTNKWVSFRNGATRLYSNADGVLQVQNASGQLATLDASNIFADHFFAASGGPIYVGATVLPYTNNTFDLGSPTSAFANIYAASGYIGNLYATNRLVIPNRTSDPASPSTGEIWLRTDL